MAKDYGIDMSLIQMRDDDSRDQRGWSKNFFSFRKMFRKYLRKLNVPFFDSCCPEDSNPFPVRYNGEKLERFDGKEWIEIPVGGSGPDPNMTYWYSSSNPPEKLSGSANIDPKFYSLKWSNYDPVANISVSNGTVVGQVFKVYLSADSDFPGYISLINGSNGIEESVLIGRDSWVLFMFNGIGWNVIDYEGDVTWWHPIP